MVIGPGARHEATNASARPYERAASTYRTPAAYAASSTACARASRGSAEARRRGLIHATVGRGTFVASAPVRASSDQDLSVNTPPTPDWMPGAFRDTLSRLASDTALADRMLTYNPRFGNESA